MNDNENDISKWANFPVMLAGRRILLHVTQDPERVFEAVWETTSPNGKYARLHEPLQKIGTWYHIVNDINLRDVLE